MKSFRIALAGLLAILLLPALVAAQSLPSPSYKNLTVTGALTSSGIGPFVLGADLTGSTDTRARFVAADTAAFTIPPGIYRISSNLTITNDVTFQAGAQLRPDSGVTVTLSGQVAGPRSKQLFAGSGNVVVANATEVWTSWWGALFNKTTDAAPAFRAAMGSNRTVRSVPATYLFCSTVPAGPMLGQYFPANVWPVSFTGIEVDNRGSTFNVCNAASFSAYFFFDRNSGAHLNGGTYNGNHTGYPSNGSAPAIVTHNQLGSIFENIIVGGNYGGGGSGIAGDFIANSVYRNNTMSGVGQAMDVAFLYNTTIENLIAVGAGVDGTTTLPGSKGLSVIQDVPGASADNHLPFAIPTNTGVTITGSSLSNFNSCGYITSGLTIKVLNNHFYNCPGNSGGAQGVGLELGYEVGSSEGYPLTDVLVSGNTVENNGAVGAGAGISIDNGNIVNSDVMSGIRIVNNTISNNKDQGIRLTGSGHLQNIDLTTGNMFLAGANQTYPMSGIAPAIQNPPPTLTSCNSGTASSNASNSSGSITEGASSGGCVLTFAKKQANYPLLPTCFAWPIGTPTSSTFSWSVSSGGSGAILTIVNGTTDTRNYGYQCSGN